jgi:hypothetical protein
MGILWARVQLGSEACTPCVWRAQKGFQFSSVCFFSQVRRDEGKNKGGRSNSGGREGERRRSKDAKNSPPERTVFLGCCFNMVPSGMFVLVCFVVEIFVKGTGVP